MPLSNKNVPAVSQLAGEIAAEQVFANYFEALKKSYGAEHQFSGLTLWTVAKEVRDIFSAALSEREEKVAELIESAEEMDSPTSWWDSDMRTCRFCGSENFDSHGLLIHGAACRVLKLRAALSDLGE